MVEGDFSNEYKNKGGIKMGAISFQKTAVAPTAGEGFNQLIEDAKYERGHNGYNGTISTCSLGSITKSFRKYDNDNKIIAREHIRNLDNGVKYRADVVDLGVKYYIVRSVTVVQKEVTAEYKKMYAVCDFDGILRPWRKHVFEKKTDAVKCATTEALSGKENVRVRKMPILMDGNDITTEIQVTEKRYDCKPSKVGKNCEIVEMHEYIYYGWAAE